jgi:hypothetical protein
VIDPAPHSTGERRRRERLRGGLDSDGVGILVNSSGKRIIAEGVLGGGGVWGGESQPNVPRGQLCVMDRALEVGRSVPRRYLETDGAFVF